MLPLARERASEEPSIIRADTGTGPGRRRRIQPIGWLVIFTFLHGTLYAAVVPPWQAPDENVHYEYLRALWQAPGWFPEGLERSASVYQTVMASARQFRWWEFVRFPTPAEVPAQPSYSWFTIRGGWSLYYRLSFPVYGLFQAAPLEVQLYALRLYSVALQCLTVWLTSKLARLIFVPVLCPVDDLLPLAAAMVVALQPQYTFISASFNDDNLVPPLAAGALYALVRGLQQRADWRWLVVAATATGLAFLTKRTAVSLVILFGLATMGYAVVWLRSSRLGKRAVGSLVLAAGALLGGLALYVVIQPPQLPPSLAALLRVQPDAVVSLASFLGDPIRLAQVPWLAPLLFLSVSFWGWFGWLKAPLSTPIMEALRRVTLVLVIGCILAFIRALRAACAGDPSLRLRLVAMTAVGLGPAFSLLVLVAQFLIGPPVYGLTGRYLFPFISVFGILAVWGWQAWWPARLKPAGVLLGLVLLSGVDFAALVLTIVPYFYS